jgi:MFS family permease
MLRFAVFPSRECGTDLRQISLSSIAPLAGRFTQIFSARNCIFVSSIIFSIGLLVTSQAPSFAAFLVGRVISGIGAAGILTISIILVLELTGKKRRGLFIGLVNAGYTSGVALGAVVAGALLPVTGWRALFWMQTPFVLLAGTAVFFSIPKSFVSGPQSPDKETMRQKVAKIDYIGAVTLVMPFPPRWSMRTRVDCSL